MPFKITAQRAIIEAVTPQIDSGRHPVKRITGEPVHVTCDAYMDGHDIMAICLAWQERGAKAWQETSMLAEGNDRYSAGFTPEKNTRYRYRIHAWFDDYATWLRDTGKKRDAKQDIALELKEGHALVILAADRAPAALAKKLHAEAARIEKESQAAQWHSLTAPALLALLAQAPNRAQQTTSPTLEVIVDRHRAEFGAWYEIFPRSQGADASKSGTFKDCIARLPAIAAMGFDVLYLTPIHPIGKTFRKGPNNTLNAGPNDPGSPYAIGSAEGGHMALEPQLGTLKDFQSLVKAAAKHGLELAMDFAIQCSPNHPWIAAHPEWFEFRPDGTVKYAENPPKKYQDIVNVSFASPDAGGLWQELHDTFLYWIEQGVKIFRVDNPHTKLFAFWEWVIGEIQAKHPDVIFLSESFTRPKVMKGLAKLGYTQSYTYFTWRVEKWEIEQYLTELSQSECADYMRPNFFPTTPDILPYHLHHANEAMFKIRLALAALLSPSYGMVAGYELLENEPDATGKEYADSEKYQFRPRQWNKTPNIIPFVTQLNTIRNANPALHNLKSLRFHTAQNDQVVFFSKRDADGNTVFVAINLDSHNSQSASIELPLWQFDVAHDKPYRLDDLLLGHSWEWTGSWQHLQLDPAVNPVAIFRLNNTRN